MSSGNFNVFMIGKQANLIDIAKVENHNVKVTKTGISSVDNFNKQVCDFITKDDGVNQKQVILSEDIIGALVTIMRWRRATAYLWIQKSNNGHRYLCYITDELKHSAQSFGTGIESVMRTHIYTIKETFCEYKYHEKYTENYPELNKIFQMMSDIKNVDKHFGI